MVEFIDSLLLPLLPLISFKIIVLGLFLVLQDGPAARLFEFI